jgi:poly-beta-1,6-N-acetyl-D-glucosamine synthase
MASIGVPRECTGAMTAHLPRYLLITPTRNEEAFIELTIQSVLHQTVRPVRWLIVSDGSTDRTDEIVRRYAEQANWIELRRMPERATRDFGGKAHCVNTTYERLRQVPHELVVSLDGDISFGPDYFEYLLERFSNDPTLGIGGTPFVEQGRSYDYQYSSLDHVSGACQVFRRECFDQIGGYVQSKSGGIDVIAVLSARMNGWTTRTFTEKVCEHHRPMGSATADNEWVVNFRLGERGYRLGYHPIWQVARSLYQMTRKPYIIAGAALLVGYMWAMVSRAKRPIGKELVAFQQRDQMRRLRHFLRTGFTRRVVSG